MDTSQQLFSFKSNPNILKEFSLKLDCKLVRTDACLCNAWTEDNMEDNFKHVRKFSHDYSLTELLIQLELNLSQKFLFRLTKQESRVKYCQGLCYNLYGLCFFLKLRLFLQLQANDSEEKVPRVPKRKQNAKQRLCNTINGYNVNFEIHYCKS